MQPSGGHRKTGLGKNLYWVQVSGYGVPMTRPGMSSLTERCPLSAVMGLRERKKLEAWRTIHSTALRLISERGFDAVSVEDIAGAAGVSRTTFFSYFPSKEAVVFDLDPQ